MIGDILLGILGNGAYDTLKILINKHFGQEDKNINDTFISSIDAASTRFFDMFGDRYGTPESSFLSIQQNWDVLLRSIYYGVDGIQVEDFVLDGLGLNKEQALLGAKIFIEFLDTEMRKNWQLDKILTEKKHIIESDIHIKETNEKLDFLVNFISGLATMNQTEASNNVTTEILTDVGSKAVKYGEKYSLEFDNGCSINYMLDKDVVYVEYVFEDGATAYYEVEYNGSVRNSKFPYPLNEYEIDIPEESLIDRKITNFPNGNIQETLIFRWGKQFTITKNSNGHILNINVQGETEVDHRKKKIIFK